MGNRKHLTAVIKSRKVGQSRERNGRFGRKSEAIHNRSVKVLAAAAVPVMAMGVALTAGGSANAAAQAAPR